jgi:hypothetical protein
MRAETDAYCYRRPQSDNNEEKLNFLCRFESEKKLERKLALGAVWEGTLALGAVWEGGIVNKCELRPPFIVIDVHRAITIKKK